MKRTSVIAVMIGILSLAWLLRQGEEIGPPELTRSSTATRPLNIPTALGAMEAMIKIPDSDVKGIVTKGMKLFLSSEEVDRMREIVSEHENIDEAVAVLTREESSFDKFREIERINAVTFLASAMMDSENPSRDYAVTGAKEVIAADTVFTTNDKRQRKSRAGDKIELFQILLDTDPMVAMEIFDSSKETPNQPIMRFAKGNYEFKNQLTATQ